MTFLIPNPGVRDVYTSDAGDNDNTGESVVLPKKTLTDGIAVVNSLSPPPGLLTPASVVDSGASRYTENCVIPDNVQFGMQYCSVQGVGGTVIVGGSNAQATFLTISTSPASGDVGYSTNGKSRISLDSRAILLNGPNQTGSLVTDNGPDLSSEVFQTVGQILARFDNSIALDYSATGGKPKRLQCNEINLEGNNSIGFRYNTTATEVLSLNAGAITDTGGAGNVGIEVVAGECAAFVTEVDCETAIIVRSGGKLDMFNAHIKGDIVVESGGVLRMIGLDHHSGTITNFGTLDGIINGVHYGSYKEGSNIVATFLRASTISSSPQNNGNVTIDTTTDTINEILCSYRQTSNSSRTVNAVMKNANNGDIYYTSTLTDTGIGYKQFTLTPTGTPLPTNQTVNLVFETDRDGGVGVSDANIQIDYTRI